MATSRGRKSTANKKEEKVVESPKKEVIESKPKVPKKAPKKVEAPPVKEELPPSPPALAPEPEPIAIPEPEPIAEDMSTMKIGSTVYMPGRQIGTIISVDRKGRFEVKSDSRKRKIYAYEASQLILIK
jgi:hypothetical protein